MPVTTSQQIAQYYEHFRTIDVTFTKEVIGVTLLNPKQVFIKCLGYQWPCIVYSSSMEGARIITNLKTSLKDALQKSNNHISLRFSFFDREKVDPLAFFVPARILGITPYNKEKPELVFLAVQFTQRPPDDLIGTLGELLEANVNSKKRKEERIVVTVESLKKMGIASKNSHILIDGVPRKCILRDVSFSGARFIVFGVAKFIVNKQAILHLPLEDPDDTVDLQGTIIRYEPVEGRSDIGAYAMQFVEDEIPVQFKMRINQLFRGSKKKKPGADAEVNNGA
ncbi:MAG: PilZ domain-containing protein [Spirochaetaceae bacterium]|nr:MAG: PilZ domain-containing protein [Spirochaetaceae bacterium]